MPEYLGGTYYECKGLPGHGHHMLARTALRDASSDLSRNSEAPCVNLDEDDHRNTFSHGGNAAIGYLYRDFQAELIRDDREVSSFYVDVRNIHQEFGTKYDEGILQAERQLLKLAEEKRIVMAEAVRKEVEERQKRYEELLAVERVLKAEKVAEAERREREERRLSEKEKVEKEAAKAELGRVEAELALRDALGAAREREAVLRAESVRALETRQSQIERELRESLDARVQEEAARVREELRRLVEARMREEYERRLQVEEAKRLDMTYGSGMTFH